MRNLLINHAEAKHAQKRGGEVVKVDLDARQFLTLIKIRLFIEI